MEAKGVLEFFNSLNVPGWIGIVVAGLVSIVILIGLLNQGITQLSKTIQEVRNIVENLRDREKQDFIRLRNLFVKHQIYEINNLNREADWNDFNYTELEAEVEVDPYTEPVSTRSKVVFVLTRLFKTIMARRIHYGTRVEKNLSKAILHSKARAFLLIGEPGSGKTVSLRHMFIRMATQCVSSRDRYAKIPIYLNLKHLTIAPNTLNADDIHHWIMEELRKGQDRTIHDFLERNFDTLLAKGVFFFLFDSFDEIPAVMDAQEHEKIVSQYAHAINRFVYAPHGGQGLIASRPYRAPTVFIAEKLTIRPLSDERIKKALDRYLTQKIALSKRLWLDLVRRSDDLLDTARNPFYLNLLVAYAKDKEQLPERDYDLFQNFLERRVYVDSERLSHFSLDPGIMLDRASLLAFMMFNSPNLGLEASENEIIAHVTQHKVDVGWTDRQATDLINALSYSQLGRRTSRGQGLSATFAFVHRRFHEYFCARYALEHSEILSMDSLATDNRWREVLVLLCEVWPIERLAGVFQVARSALSSGLSSQPNSQEYYRAIETLRFLRDGFKSRIGDLPNDIRKLCSKFMFVQLESGNLLDQKRTIESVALADDSSVSNLLELALRGDSHWLRETAIRSCRILSQPTPSIEISIRRHLFELFEKCRLYPEFDNYCVNFSTKSSFHPLRSYTRALMLITIVIGALYAGALARMAIKEPEMLIGLIIVLPLTLLLRDLVEIEMGAKTTLKGSDGSKKSTYKFVDFLQRLFGRPLQSLPVLSAFILPLGKALFPGHYYVDTTVYIILLFTFVIAGFFELNLLSKTLNYPGTIYSWLHELVLNVIYIPRMLYRSILRSSLSDKAGWLTSISLLAWMLASFFLFAGKDFTPSKVYGEFNLAVASIITVGAIVYLVLMFAAAVVLAISFLRGSRFALYTIWALFRDQAKFLYITLNPDNHPKTAPEAMKQLDSFESNQVKLQYARALMRWLPIGRDTKIIADEANKHTGLLRDALFQLVEIWEDANPKSGAQIN